MQQPFGWLQHHRELQPPRPGWWAELLQAHVPRDLVFRVQDRQLLRPLARELPCLLEAWLAEREAEAQAVRPFEPVLAEPEQVALLEARAAELFQEEVDDCEGARVVRY